MNYLIGLGFYALLSIVTYLVTWSGPWLDLYVRMDTGRGVNSRPVQLLLTFRWWVIAYAMAFFTSLLILRLTNVAPDAFSAARWGMMTIQILFLCVMTFGESISGPLEVALKGPGGALVTWIAASHGWHLGMAARLCHP